MRRVAVHLAALAAVALALPSSGHGQDERVWKAPVGSEVSADIILYRSPNFEGQSVRVQTSVPDLGVTWNPRSVRIVRGAWQLCERTDYRGDCTVVRENVSSSGIGRVRSARPVKTLATPSGGAGPSLRGVASEFFRAPARDGERVRACASGSATIACARATAERFCLEQGYRHVANVATETVSRRVYLADVLCRRTGI